MSKSNYRLEHDLLGEMKIADELLYGIHTHRAAENFKNLSGHPVHQELIKAFGPQKEASARASYASGAWKGDKAKFDAIIQACKELEKGLLAQHVVADAFQGGAGTSMNINVNEVIANRALEILGDKRGNYDRVSPLGDINLHQSTNDACPTALRIATINLLTKLEAALKQLQTSFQKAEKKFADVVKIGRTELQGAVLITLGQEMGAYAKCLERDRTRVAQCKENLLVVNLGATAVGNGIGAPNKYVKQVVKQLSEITGLKFTQADDLFDATQNEDAWAEVSGVLKTCAVNLLKIAGDLRFMGSDQYSSIGEVKLPERQAGSSIMPGKVNPVIPEAVSQAAMQVMGNDVVVNIACSSGNLELNAFFPVIADNVLNSIDLLTNACIMFSTKCIDGLEANREVCLERAHNTPTAVITALLPVLGYPQASELVILSRETGKRIVDLVIEKKLLTKQQLDDLFKAEKVRQIGY